MTLGGDKKLVPLERSGTEVILFTRKPTTQEEEEQPRGAAS